MQPSALGFSPSAPASSSARPRSRWVIGLSRFDEILIDECQDINHARHALVRLLSARHGRVFAVGDDAQAIYGFRGAEVAHMHSLPSRPAPRDAGTDPQDQHFLRRFGRGTASQPVR